MILMKTWKFPAAIAVSAALALAGCASGTPAGSATPEQKTVIAAFYPFEFLTQRVGGDHVTVTNLTSPGAEPHDLELTPKQVASLTGADLVVFQAGLQPAVDDAVAQTKPKATIDTSKLVEMRTATEDGDDEGGQGVDPHTWLDPTNMITFTAAIAAQLSQTDPAHASDYQANAAALTADLQKIDGDYTAGLASCQRRAFITSHAAFGYLAHRYNLVQIPIAGLSPEIEPSPARIAEVQDLASKNGITTIFFETLASPAMATSIAGDLHLATDVLDPIEGLTKESRGTNYLEIMSSNLTALRTANGCQ